VAVIEAACTFKASNVLFYTIQLPDDVVDSCEESARTPYDRSQTRKRILSFVTLARAHVQL
jgi:hypothetical protein